MASLQLYSSYNELKKDRVKRPLTQKEKLRQEKAVKSLSKIKKVARASTPSLLKKNEKKSRAKYVSSYMPLGHPAFGSGHRAGSLFTF
ncbi:MAG: hypothetical protein ACKVOQ_08900 [Cyclobacteriaceae bacterium]